VIAAIQQFLRLVQEWRLQRRWNAPDQKIAELIKPPVVKFKDADEQLRKSTEERRAIAARARSRAAQVESGSTAGQLLKMVKR
jgi:hypothetical protein